MKRNVSIIMLILLISGCATHKPLTREESLKMRKVYDQSRTKVYEGKTKDQILSAAGKLFTMADKDYEVAHGQNGCMAQRTWSGYAFLFAEYGMDSWYVTTEENGNKVKVMVRLVSQEGTIAGTPTGTESGAGQATQLVSFTNPDMIDQKEMQNRGAVYHTFFKRLDYLLDLDDQWSGCRQANAEKKRLKLSGSLNPLCFMATDRKPEAIR